MVRVGPRQPKPANRPAKKEAGIQRDIETLVESLTGISATTILTPDHRGFVVSDGSISIREMKGFPALEIRFLLRNPSSRSPTLAMRDLAKTLGVSTPLMGLRIRQRRTVHHG